MTLLNWQKEKNKNNLKHQKRKKEVQGEMQTRYNPEKMAAGHEKWKSDDEHAMTLVRFRDHFKDKLRRETMINNTAMVLGGALSCLATKHRTHNLAAAAFSYIGAMKTQEYLDANISSSSSKLDNESLLPLSTKEYDWLKT